jgi:hypothetical protein
MVSEEDWLELEQLAFKGKKDIFAINANGIFF